VKGGGEGATAGAGAGAEVLLCEDNCRAIKGANGAEEAVGVACGVETVEFALPTDIGVGVCRAALTVGKW